MLTIAPPVVNDRQTRVNDVTLRVATVNGSGSQTANNVLMRAIFEMGIPVSGKNLFPSNIEGEPTWYSIRANKDGNLSMQLDPDVMVCFCPQTVTKDVQNLPPGALVIYDLPLEANKIREDLAFLGVPFTKLAASIPDIEPRVRKLLANMIYVGVIAELLEIDMAEIEKAISKQFKGKAKPTALNVQAAKLGAAYAAEHSEKLQFFRLERMKATAGKIIIDGNTAVGMGCIMAGCTVLPWYPITPASTVCDAFTALAHEYRQKDGKATYAIAQTEDELAAFGMVLGAGWAGARAMTATSGPGISLMAELFGLAYYTEIPAVVINVQRVGPSTGLPTRTMQSDILSVAFLSHGDTKHPMLFPGSVNECYSMAVEIFDYAEQFQTPFVLMSDLDLGMNNWVADAFPYPEKPINRGKVLDAEQIEQLRQQGKKFERYRDVDGDGVPYRTLPGTEHPQAAYFTRGTGHNERACYSEDPEEFTRNMMRLVRKFDSMRTVLPAPVVSGDPSSEIGLIAYGSTDVAMSEAKAQLRARGITTEYLRIRSFPFHPSIAEFIARKKRVYVIEQNRDGQMAQLLKLDLPADLAGRVGSVLHFNGWPIDAASISDAVQEKEKKK